MDEWLEARRNTDLSPNTREVERIVVRSQILPYPGELELQRLSPKDVGSLVQPDTLSSRWKSLERLAGVRPIGLRGARHTHATLALAAGARLDVVSRQLGHASIGIPADGDDWLAAYPAGVSTVLAGQQIRRELPSMRIRTSRDTRIMQSGQASEPVLSVTVANHGRRPVTVEEGLVHPQGHLPRHPIPVGQPDGLHARRLRGSHLLPPRERSDRRRRRLPDARLARPLVAPR
jgi:hypothetical protein